MGNKVKIFEFEGKQITFEFENGQKMVNATQMAKAFNKRVYNFTRLPNTKKFIGLMEKKYIAEKNQKLLVIKTIQSGDAKLQGTWMCEQLALKFAAWLSVEFEIWVYSVIHEVLTSEQKELDIENAKWHLKQITENIDNARNLLDTIPFQEEDRRRIKMDKKK